MNERDIFLEALEKISPDARRVFLERICAGDAQLHLRLELLLKSHEEADSLLDHPVLGDAVSEVAADSTDRLTPEVSADDTAIHNVLEPSNSPSSLGRIGHYDVRNVIGRGGMGIVFQARDTKLGRVVAIKVLAPELAAHAAARTRFLREARAAAAISHDHVVTVHAIEENERPTDPECTSWGGSPYLVMEFVGGESLMQKLDREGPLECQEILGIGWQVAAALEAAHQHGLIHRDIKPSNILLQNNVERVKMPWITGSMTWRLRHAVRNYCADDVPRSSKSGIWRLDDARVPSPSAPDWRFRDMEMWWRAIIPSTSVVR